MSEKLSEPICQNLSDAKKISLLSIQPRLSNLLDRAYRVEQAMRRAHYLTVHTVSGTDSALISLGLKQIALLQQDIQDCCRDLGKCLCSERPSE